jgi:hypothetical protein
LFLAWSWRIASQGTASCYQVVAHKNLNSFNRKVFIGRSSLAGVRGPEKEQKPRMVASSGNGAAHAE